MHIRAHAHMLSHIHAYAHSKHPCACVIKASTSREGSPPLGGPAPFSPSKHVQDMPRNALVSALKTLGVTGSCGLCHDSWLHEKLLETLGGSSREDWEATLQGAVERRLVEFFMQYLSEDAAKRSAMKAFGKAARNYEAMWRQILLEYCPPAPVPPDRRGKRVLIIGPGFGFLQNPA